MKRSLYSGVAAVALGFASPAMAGNIVLTGHDNDFHESSAAHASAVGALNLVRDGSALPVLVIDNGSEAVTLVNDVLGTGHEVTKTVGALTAADFNHSLYSAFVVASVTTCGGCDNPVGTGSFLASHFSTAIATFFNAGGGIYGLAGATDPSAYAYVPESATNAGGSPPRTGYVTTAAGIALGVPAVNGDTTHNFFNEPGTGGLSSLYQVTERLGSATTGTPETIALVGGTISCTVKGTCTITTHSVPEPMTLSVLGAGLFGLGMARKRWRK